MIPTLAAVIRNIMEQAQQGMYTAMPGRVESYDSAKQSANIQPLILQGFTDELGERRTERLAVITDVPVVFPGAGDYSITFPVQRGDVVLVIIASCSLDRWLVRGGEVDPSDDRRQALSDAIAIPGLRPFNDAVGSDGVSSSAMVIKANEVRVGSADSDDPVARKTDLLHLRAGILSAVISTGSGGASAIITAADTAAGGVGQWPKCSDVLKVD